MICGGRRFRKRRHSWGITQHQYISKHIKVCTGRISNRSVFRWMMNTLLYGLIIGRVCQLNTIILFLLLLLVLLLSVLSPSSSLHPALPSVP